MEQQSKGLVYDIIILRLGDLTVKGRNRGRFERQMGEQVRKALQGFSGVELLQTFGRLWVELNGTPHEPVMKRLSELFGIASLSPAIKVETELEAIRHAAAYLVHTQAKKPVTFKVSAKRAWKGYPHGSQELNHLIGAHVLRETPDLKVDVRHPDVNVRVDLQEGGTYLFCEMIPGAGGFPFGSNGKAMLMLSGGIDSPVAAWHAMRKGLEIEAVHFHSYPYTSQQAKDKVIELTRQLSYYANRPVKLHMVPFVEIQTLLAAGKQQNLLITLMRRAMLRITEQLAEKRSANGIVTGESLGQVASQTLASMSVIGRVVNLPLLRPVLALDKLEIIRTAEHIGTYETSILPYEDCCTLFIPKSPSTNPNLGVVESVEANLPQLPRLINEAVEATELLSISAFTAAKVEQAGEDSWF